MKKRFLVVGMFLLVVNCYALDGIEVTTGYLEAKIKEKDRYEGIPLFVSFDFDAKPFFSKLGVNPIGKLDFVCEPFINTIIEPNNNVEMGLNSLIKYVYPLTKRWQPYVKGGLGVVYMTQHTREQSTQYNFLSQVGGGVYTFLNDNTALNFEYRYRHLSNASFKHPNKGINTDLFLGGISFFFD